ncbi:MAG: hypothetical protein ACTSR2_11240, partial [Candidatus Hodarchaeales archaeon]
IFAGDAYTGDTLQNLGVDITNKEVQVAEKNIKLIIIQTLWHWSLEHQKQRLKRLKNSIRTLTAACVIFFDKGNRQSFNSVDTYYEYWVKFMSTENVSISPVALVGFFNESENVSHDEGQAKASDLNATYFEINWKKNTEIEEVFIILAEKYLENYPKNEI